MANNLDDDMPSSAQVPPCLSDSPDQDALNNNPEEFLKGPKVNVKEVLKSIELKMKERFRIVTIKESMQYHKRAEKLPGFMSVHLRFTPGVGNPELFDSFSKAKNACEKELTTSYLDTMIEFSGKIINEFMSEVYELKNQANSALDIKDPANGPKRTELNNGFQEILDKYRTERANYASKLRIRGPDSKPKESEDGDKGNKRTADRSHWKDNNKLSTKRRK